MKVNRAQFIHHLERLACSGQVTEAVFSGAFGAAALTPDQLLLAVAPPVPAVEPLAEDIGVADLALFARALKLLTGEGNTGIEVDVYVQDQRLVIDDGPRGVQHLLIAAPRTIGTRVEESTVEKLLAFTDGKEGVHLERSVLDGVAAAFSLYKADEVVLYVGPLGGKITVGAEHAHSAEFGLAELIAPVPYVLHFSRHLVDVFSVIHDFSNAMLYLGGAGRPITITDGGYRYMLSPRAVAAEDNDKRAGAWAEGQQAAAANGAGKKKAGKKAATPKEAEGGRKPSAREKARASAARRAKQQ